MEDTRSTGKPNLPDKNKIPHPLALNYLLMFHLNFFPGWQTDFRPLFVRIKRD